MANTKKTEANPHEKDARIVAGPKARAAGEEPSEVDAAWLKWSRGDQKPDDRSMARLKAAFEAGWIARGQEGRFARNRDE